MVYIWYGGRNEWGISRYGVLYEHGIYLGLEEGRRSRERIN